MAELWGDETRKAVANFPVSGAPIPARVIHWLGRIKAAAARVNAELGLLDTGLADGDRRRPPTQVAAGDHDDQFPIDVFQTGSGTSSNMNANEVIATIAGGGAHPNDHVNLGQSSNDVFPSAVHLAALDAITNELLPSLDTLASALTAKADEFAHVVKAGRTHLMDAVPVTLGQEFGGYAAQIRQAHARVSDALPRLAPDPARRHGSRHRAQHPPGVRGAGPRRAHRDDGSRHPPARRRVRSAGQPRRTGRDVRRAQGRRRLAHQDRQRPALDVERAAHRARRDRPARVAEGLVDHAGQGQPGDPRGGRPGRRPGDRQRRGDHGRWRCRATSSST